MKEFIKEDSVHIRSDMTTSKMMKHVLIALIPIILFSFYKNGVLPFANGNTDIYGLFLPLILILVGVFTSVILEVIYAKLILRYKKNKLKEHMKNSYAIFPGLFLGLILPLQIPLYLLMLGVFVGVVFGKLIFGGFGKNIFNPALLGYLFLFLIFPMNFSSNNYLNNYELDGVSGATPLSTLQAVDYVGSYNEVVEPYGDLVDLFIGFKPGAGAEVSILLCLLALLYLVWFKVIKFRIPIIYVSTVFLMTAFIGYQNNMEMWYALFNILTGGLVFGAIFMATDPVTSPVTGIGQIIFGLCLGILTVFFRYLMPYPEGVMMSILIMNAVVLLIDKIGAISRFDYRKIALFITIPVLIGIGLMVYISSTLVSADVTIIDKNFKIISKTRENSYVNYVVTQKCFYPVKAKITLNIEGVVTSILIMENSETFWKEIEKNDYINKIINNQSDLSKLDTISGVTRTSNGLQQMINNTIADYKATGVKVN